MKALQHHVKTALRASVGQASKIFFLSFIIHFFVSK